MSRTLIRAPEAAVTLLLLVVLAGAVVDEGSVPRRAWLDLDDPPSFALAPERVEPSPLGYFQFSGEDPLAVAGSLRPGDRIRLKLRTGPPGQAVEISLDGEVVTALAVDDAWREYELQVDRSARELGLRATDGAPVHVSRISWNNLRAEWEEGPIRVLVLHEPAGPDLLPSTVRHLPLAAAVAATLLLLAAARARRRRAPPRAALRAVLAAASPAAAALLAGALLPLGGPLRLVVSSAAFAVLVLVGPALLELAPRARAAMRALAPRLRRRGEAPPEDAPHQVGAGAWLVLVVLALLLTAVVARLVVFELDGVLFGTGDVNQWLVQNDYVAEHLDWWPAPHLELVNDDFFYPYGGSNVFQPWVLEMHLAGAAAEAALGPGPWVRLYFLGTLLVTALVGFLLLGREHGPLRGGVAALALAFGGFYGLAKYPGHLGVGIAHWTILGILADHLLARRIAAGRIPSARLLAGRALLLVLALGQDLGYVAGLSLTSFTVTAVWAAGVVARRGGLRPAGFGTRLRATARALRASAGEHPWHTGALAAATAAAGWVLVPVVAHITLAASRFDFSGMGGAGWWADPRRMLTPILPGLDRASFFARFADSPEGLFAATPGLAFVLAAALGLVAGRRRLAAAVPPALTLLLLLSYHPSRLPLLSVLPWFGFTRVTGRFTVAYPALLVVLALSAPRGALRRRWARAVAAGLLLLLVVEGTTAYGLVMHPRRYFHPPADFARLVAAVRAAPGEGVLEWPFCVTGGNGVGSDLMGAYYTTLSGSFGLEAFHGKKIVGRYFGRLHPEQLEPYVEAGWPELFLPEDREIHHATRQRRDFHPHEWEFLERFVALNDVCGILLYPELLQPETVEGFHRRFGTPAAIARSPFGILEFIPKPAAWQAREDASAGRTLSLPDRAPALVPGVPLHLGTTVGDEYVLEGWGPGEEQFRATTAERAALEFSAPEGAGLTLRLEGLTFERQRVGFVLNGRALDTIVFDGDAWQQVALPLPSDALQAENELVLLLPDAHSPASVGVNQDTRQLGLTVRYLELVASP